MAALGAYKLAAFRVPTSGSGAVADQPVAVKAKGAATLLETRVVGPGGSKQAANGAPSANRGTKELAAA